MHMCMCTVILRRRHCIWSCKHRDTTAHIFSKSAHNPATPRTPNQKEFACPTLPQTPRVRHFRATVTKSMARNNPLHLSVDLSSILLYLTGGRPGPVLVCDPPQPPSPPPPPPGFERWWAGDMAPTAPPFFPPGANGAPFSSVSARFRKTRRYTNVVCCPDMLTC